jgi:hypothetical protein
MPHSPLPKNEKTAFVRNFEFVGTIDSSPYLCVPAAIEYRKSLGGEDAICNYLSTLARRGGEIVSKILGTETLENEEGTLGNCAFSNVRLPLDPQTILALNGDSHLELADRRIAVRDWMSQTNAKEYGTFIALMWYGGAWWARLSAQIYLELSDFEKGGRILLELSERVKKGEFLRKTGTSKL